MNIDEIEDALRQLMSEENDINEAIKKFKDAYQNDYSELSFRIALNNIVQEQELEDTEEYDLEAAASDDFDSRLKVPDKPNNQYSNWMDDGGYGISRDTGISIDDLEDDREH